MGEHILVFQFWFPLQRRTFLEEVLPYGKAAPEAGTGAQPSGQLRRLVVLTTRNTPKSKT